MSDTSCTHKYMAEMIGTLVLVLFGCGSAVLAGDAIGFTGIAFSFGFALLIMVYAIGPISGCHVNPAVTIGMMFAKKMDTREGVMYIIFQCIGALIGAFLLQKIAMGTGNAVTGLAANGFGTLSPMGYDQTAAFITELVFTAIFMFVILAVTSGKASPGFAGLAIGIALVVIHLVTIPVTGTSVNPARSFGPAVLMGGESLDQLWLFFVAPIIGAVLGTVVWNSLNDCEHDKK